MHLLSTNNVFFCRSEGILSFKSKITMDPTLGALNEMNPALLPEPLALNPNNDAINNDDNLNGGIETSDTDEIEIDAEAEGLMKTFLWVQFHNIITAGRYI